jgi:Acetyltransferases
LEIRKPNTEELEEISKLSKESMLEATLGEANISNKQIKKIFKPLLEKGCYYIAGLENGKLIGWIMIGSNEDYFTKQKAGFIYELYIKNEFRRKGYARELMNYALKLFKEEGYDEARLNVYARNGAKKLYELLGFTPKNMIMNKKL